MTAGRYTVCLVCVVYEHLCVFWFISMRTAGCKTIKRHSDLQLSSERMQRINVSFAGGSAVLLSVSLFNGELPP